METLLSSFATMFGGTTRSLVQMVVADGATAEQAEEVARAFGEAICAPFNGGVQ